MSLVAELGHDLMRFGCLHQLTDFVNRMGERFFAVEMFPMFDRGHPRHRVEMIGGSDHYGIDALMHIVKHLAEIAVTPGIGIFLKRVRSMAFIDVAQSNDVVATGDGIEIACPLAADANPSNIDSVARRGFPAGCDYVAGHNTETSSGYGCGREKLTAGKC